MSLPVCPVARGCRGFPGPADAAVLVPPDSLGVNFTGSPPDLATASTAGVGLARDEVIEGTNTDAIVELTAAAHLRLYPMLGLPASHGAAADATAMTAFVTSFAQRYGPGGTFWAGHPELPYLPVESFEIGNEPDITPTEPADETSLHYANPADYAEVYEAARTALHEVDPTAQAVVGGMLDSGAVTLATAERYLAAIGPMDAVGFHPYLYDVTTMEQDTIALRAWLDANGHAAVPLDINEFGAPVSVSDWGAQTAEYTQWALCTPALHVEKLLAFWWGAIPIADSDIWFPMVNTEITETSLGSAYLNAVQALTTQGCPVAGSSAPAATTSVGQPTTMRRKLHHRRRKPIRGARGYRHLGAPTAAVGKSTKHRACATTMPHRARYAQSARCRRRAAHRAKRRPRRQGRHVVRHSPRHTVDRSQGLVIGLSASVAGWSDIPDRLQQVVSSSGTKWLREEFEWSQIEPQPRTFDFSHYDQFVLQAVQHNTHVLALLFNTPAWAGPGATAIPADPSAYAAYVAAVVGRYGPHGSFWAQHPGLSGYAIETYELWNEPYYANGDNGNYAPGRYARLVKAAAIAGHQADPSAHFLLAAENDAQLVGSKWVWWIDALYTASRGWATSTCSAPSVKRKATRLPSRPLATDINPFVSCCLMMIRPFSVLPAHVGRAMPLRRLREHFEWTEREDLDEGRIHGSRPLRVVPCTLNRDRAASPHPGGCPRGSRRPTRSGELTYRGGGRAATPAKRRPARAIRTL